MCRQFDSAFGHQSNEPGAFRPGRLPEARGRNRPGLFAFGERFSIVDVAAKPDGALEALAVFVGLTRQRRCGGPPTAQGHHLGFENPARAKLAAKMRRSECQGAQATRIGAAAWRASAE